MRQYRQNCITVLPPFPPYHMTRKGNNGEKKVNLTST